MEKEELNLEDRFFMEWDEYNELKEIFAIFKDEDDNINTKELKAGFEFMKLDRKMPRIFDLILKLEEEGEYISEEQFLMLISYNVGHRQNEEGQLKLFETLCQKGNSQLLKEDIKELATRNGDMISETEISEMVQQFSNHKDHMDGQDFTFLMGRKPIGQY